MTTSLRIGINGLGRIGRAVYRVLARRGGARVVAVNDVNGDVGNLAYLLRYDSLYGPMPGEVKLLGEHIIHDGRSMRVTHADRIDAAPWSGCDLVIDASGVPDNARRARALLDRVRTVLVTNASGDADATLVFGVEDLSGFRFRGRVIATSTCDASACAPVLAALDRGFGVEHGFITTLHPWLGYQNLLDGAPPKMSYGGPRDEHYVLGRAAIGSLLPKPTSLIPCCAQVIPHLAPRVQATSFRVPTAIVSGADMTICLGRDTSSEEVLAHLASWPEQLGCQRLFDLCDQPLASIDYLGREVSASIDTRWLSVSRGRWLKLLLWYDNEWGYAAKVADAVELAVSRVAAEGDNRARTVA